MLTSVDPLAHAVVVETFACILENVYAVNNKRFIGLKKDLFRMEESFGHPLNLLVVVVVNLATVVEHVADVGNRQTKLIKGLCGFLVRSIPEAAHGVLDMLLNRVSVRHAVCDVGHAMEIEGTNEETLHEASNFGIVMGVVGLSGSSNQCSSKSTIHLYVVLIKESEILNYYKSQSIYLYLLVK